MLFLDDENSMDNFLESIGFATSPITNTEALGNFSLPPETYTSKPNERSLSLCIQLLKLNLILEFPIQ